MREQKTRFQLLKWLAPPQFGDADRTRRARILSLSIWGGIGLTIILGSLEVIWSSHPWRAIWIVLVLLVIEGIALLLLWLGHLDGAAVFLIAMVWSVHSGLIIITNGNYSPNLYRQLILVALAGLLLGWRASVVFALATVIW